MGEGEFAGEGTLLLLLPPGIGMGAAAADWGVLWAMAGESKPN